MTVHASAVRARLGRSASFLGRQLSTLVLVLVATTFVRANTLEQSARAGETSTTLADGRVLIAGGDAAGSAEMFDPSTGQTTALDAPMRTPRAYHSAILLADGNVLIVGGYVADSESIEGSAELFLAASGTFVKTAGPARVARIQPTLTLREDGVVIVSGGSDGASPEFYDPAAQKFGADPAAAWIATDRGDYAPGQTVTFTGGGWMAGETVRITLSETPDIHADRDLFATAGDSGEFVNTEFAPEPHDLGVTFTVTATGTTSLRQASWTFTDSAPTSAIYRMVEGTGTILTTGPIVDIGNHCDDCVTRVQLPFPVMFYDQAYTVAAVSSNGTVQFASGSSEFDNTTLPTRAFGPAIMPYWDDLLTTPARSNPPIAIYQQTTGTAPNRVFHLWWHVLFASQSGPANFELLMYESEAKFDVVYGGSGTGFGTIGVQKSSDGPFTMYAASPNANIAPLAGVKLTFTGVPLLPTSTSLESSSNPAVYGQPVTFTATVTSSGSPITGGTITFTDGATDISGPIDVNAAGQATFTTSTLDIADHAITATFNADATRSGSRASIRQIVDKATTQTNLASSHDGSTFGDAVTFTATVTVKAPGAGLPSGSVVFKDGDVVVAGPVALDADGNAAFTTSTLGAGVHTIAAEYSGSDTHNGSTGWFDQTVNKATSSFSNLASPTIVFGTSQATMSGAIKAGSFVPGGNVTIAVAGVTQTTAIQEDGGFIASFATGTLGANSYTITYSYGGDANFTSATGAGTLVVNKATPAFGVVTSSSITYGQATTDLSGSIAAGALLPTGSVTISMNGVSVSTPIHADGSFSAAFDTHALSAQSSPYGITYSYAGDDNFNRAGDASGTLTVNRKHASATPNAAAKKYGDADPMLSGTLDGFLAADNVTAAFTRSGGENAGTYTIGAVLQPAGVLGNYDIAYATAAFTITPAALTIVADDQQKSAGSRDPALTYHATGFRFTDTAATVLTGALTRDPGEAVGTYTIRQGSLAPNANYTIAFTEGTLTIGFNTCLLYDPSRIAKSGSTIPIKLQVCSASGANLSSPAIVLTAADIVLVSTSTSGVVDDAGDANPDSNFRFSSGLGPGYIFNLKTTGLGTGTYNLRFHVTGDPMLHGVPFQVR